ncbi:hypothetical protein [Streptomyces iconiensis]|uniref:Phage protein, HK97 gp10 family n=1 Tax=Streptomyces iconiensis TaxID=1384038 RepID=A0ABT7A4K3_9ACTN|nr:hypothetical protein [Streptomyces iconiensis]MDJ1136216.1 hypothetical protein [Streptomyces iconiensis]
MTQHVRIRWNTQAVEGRTRSGSARGVRLAVEHLLQVSRARVPIEEGTLERSGTATVDESSLTGAVAYDTPYAVRQHEDMTLRHDSGRSAKYLEQPLGEEAATMQQIIAAQVRRALR